MILFPAIDLKGGECVRLKRGDMAQATVYHRDPKAQALEFEKIGFSWLHMVDLDGAFAGESKNAKAIEAVAGAVKIPIQLGGGIRTLDQIARWLEFGIARVILGTAAIRDPDLVREACRLFAGRIAVSLDAVKGRVAIEGWAKTARETSADMAARFEDAGVCALIHTDIERDGILKGINWEATLALARRTSIPVIASGGLASMADIDRLCAEDARILAGAITGRALYDGRIDAVRALALLDGISR